MELEQGLPNGWKHKLQGEKTKDYFQKLSEFLNHEYNSGTEIFPAQDKIFQAFQTLDYSQVRVVILGQDPYHGPRQAIGLSFAVPNDLFPKPPSLKNIFKELAANLNITIDPSKSDLSGWVKQGVFLLNTVLTVRASEAFSHRDKGWENFSDEIIEHLNARPEPIIFLLWGAAAIKKKALITNKAHFILESVHPSPLSAHRGFLGSKPFSKINKILVDDLKQDPIDWGLVSVTES